jgi:hypothetical protein
VLVLVVVAGVVFLPLRTTVANEGVVAAAVVVRGEAEEDFYLEASDPAGLGESKGVGAVMVGVTVDSNSLMRRCAVARSVLKV